MSKFFKYLTYLTRHRWYVMLECFKMGLYWRGLVHDISKYRPSEFIPYMNHFGGRVVRDKTGYYKGSANSGDRAFDIALMLHLKRNDNHWQFWGVVDDQTKIFEPVKMSMAATKEMVCDWVGAGKAQGHLSPKDDPLYEARQWYVLHKDKRPLHPETDMVVRILLGV